uniref:Uncharacterized protein n=1 Tax=Amphiprion ocellaris TaxID=80972 RepID=A0A3Q1B329_AMPOC
MLSRMLFSLLNNLHVVEKLAESRPIRRAAQITAYAITKAQIAGRDASERVMRSQTLRQNTLNRTAFNDGLSTSVLGKEQLSIFPYLLPPMCNHSPVTLILPTSFF